LNYQN